jgi:hypothetical protein
MSLGQAARARRWLEICASTLKRDLEMDPQPETIRLLQSA